MLKQAYRLLRTAFLYGKMYAKAMSRAKIQDDKITVCRQFYQTVF